jgi:hypothetical protein
VRVAGIVVGFALAILSVLIGGGAGLLGLTFLEPPHPTFGFEIARAPVAGQQTPPLSAGPWEVWIPAETGAPRACSLYVTRADGSLVDQTKRANSCTARGEALAGERWLIQATGPGVGRSVQVGPDEAVFPVPLLRTMQASFLTFSLAVALIVGLWVGGRSKRPAAGET